MPEWIFSWNCGIIFHVLCIQSGLVSHAFAAPDASIIRQNKHFQLAVFIRCFLAPAGTPLAAPQSPSVGIQCFRNANSGEPMVPRCKAFRLKQLVQGYLFQFLPDQSGYLVKHPLDLTRAVAVRNRPGTAAFWVETAAEVICTLHGLHNFFERNLICRPCQFIAALHPLKGFYNTVSRKFPQDFQCKPQGDVGIVRNGLGVCAFSYTRHINPVSYTHLELGH